MKKLFLTIGIIALAIIMIAAILALLSLFELVPFFSQLRATSDEEYPGDQAVILVAYVDSLEKQRFHVENAWVIFTVTSRMDTTLIQPAGIGGVTEKLFDKSFTQAGLLRYFERTEKLDVNYVLLIDQIGLQLVNDLLETQQSSINLSNSKSICEILESNELSLLDLYVKYGEGHVRNTIPNFLIEQLTVNNSVSDSIYCESLLP
jgi:hypothetical protein